MDALTTCYHAVSLSYPLVALALCGACSIFAAFLPPPKGATGPYAVVYGLTNALAANLGHAANASAPAVTISPAVVKTAAALLFAFSLTCGVVACDGSGGLTPQGVQIVGALCKVDGVAQPVAVSIAPTLVPSLSAAANLDNLLVHPAVVKACAGVNGTPASVTTQPAAAAPASPTS